MRHDATAMQHASNQCFLFPAANDHDETQRTRPPAVTLGAGPQAADPSTTTRRFFYFFIFYFCFLQKYIFVFEIYTNIPDRPAVGRPGPNRPAARRQGVFCKNFHKKFTLRPLEDRTPGSWAASASTSTAAGGS